MGFHEARVKFNLFASGSSFMLHASYDIQSYATLDLHQRQAKKKANLRFVH